MSQAPQSIHDDKLCRLRDHSNSERRCDHRRKRRDNHQSWLKPFHQRPNPESRALTHGVKHQHRYGHKSDPMVTRQTRIQRLEEHGDGQRQQSPPEKGHCEGWTCYPVPMSCHPPTGDPIWSFHSSLLALIEQ